MKGELWTMAMHQPVDTPKPPHCRRCGYEGPMWWHLEFSFTQFKTEPEISGFMISLAGEAGCWEDVERFAVQRPGAYRLVYEGVEIEF